MRMGKSLGIGFVMHKTSEGKNSAFKLEPYEGLGFGYFGVTSGRGEKNKAIVKCDSASAQNLSTSRLL